MSTEAKTLPNLGGSGWVRDLQEAATQSPELIALLNQAKNAETRAGYKQAVAELLKTWGNDSGYNSASKQALAAGYGLILSDPADAQEAGWMDAAIKASAADRETFRATLNATDLVKFDVMRERMVGGLERVYAYEAVTASREIATYLIAACAYQSGAAGHFYGEERMSKTTRKCLRWRFDRLKKSRLHKVQAVSSVLHFL